ncbi:MAG: tetratricopeptide repeat protein, partial [Pirellulales bacterium]
DAAIGLDFEDGKATLRIYVTSDQRGCRAVVTRGTQVHLDESFDGSPQVWYERSFDTCIGDVLDGATIVVSDRFGNVLVSWCIDAAPQLENPDPARAIDVPDRLDSVESLYLAGLHLEQYRHATREPEDYYREGLLRDPGDIRCNNALGALLYRRGLFAEAEACFRQAIERLTRHNPNPHDGEAYYNLGLSLVMQARYDEAVSAFYKATWNAAMQDAAFFQLARLAVRQAKYLEAENLLQRCLDRNAGHSQAGHLRVVVLKKLGRLQDAMSFAESELHRDPFNYGILFETSLQTGSFATFDARARRDWNNYLETAIDYASAGLLDAAIAVLKHYLEFRNHRSESALIFYYLADYCEQQGNSAETSEWYLLAEEADSSCCFPNKLSDICVLQRAASKNSTDARALYYLGNLWYDRARPERAIACWEQSRERDSNYPTVWRNLGLAYYNNREEPELAWDAFSRAIQLRPTDARVFYELDQLARRLNQNPKDRFKRLDARRSLVQERDDLYLEYVTLLNLLGRHQNALDHLLARTFHPWEGGEGKVAAQFVVATTELAREAIQEHRFDDALSLLGQAQHWPKSLGEGKLPGIKENNTYFYLGLAHHGQGQRETSRQFLELAADGNVEPTSAKYYNDHPPEMAYYQGLALRALHRENEARMRFQSLIDFGTTHLSDDVTVDFFAVSLPDFLVFKDDLDQRHDTHCRFMMALGHLGLSDAGRAMAGFDAVLSQDQSHQGAVIHRRQIDVLREFGLTSMSRDSSERAVVSGPPSMR